VQKILHIVSFDIPFPANYGGAIDVFHKIRCLHNSGIKVILHCFEYGERKPSEELEKLCNKVYYYKRQTSLINHFSVLPYNVKSRISSELKQNLIKDNYPILFEVLHSCYLLNDIDLKQRVKLFRHSNIEHDYFFELAKSEKSILKKIYFNIEALKLKWFEKNISHSSCILSVSKTDLIYFKKQYKDTPSYYLPSFHQYDVVSIAKGVGDYILYHGNLAISENYNAASWLIENVFCKLDYKVIIAGLNPPLLLVNLISKYNNIILKQDCSTSEMNDLITNAQIHCLYTSQETGLKLKLLNVLYSGRHVVANQKMLTGTDLADACTICNTSLEYINALNVLMGKSVDNLFILQRNNVLVDMSNGKKTELLISLLKD
jgi:hypothetical protein